MEQGRLALLEVCKGHAAEMYPILADASLYAFTGGEPPDNPETVEQWFQALETRASPDGKERWLTWVE